MQVEGKGETVKLRDSGIGKAEEGDCAPFLRVVGGAVVLVTDRGAGRNTLCVGRQSEDIFEQASIAQETPGKVGLEIHSAVDLEK